MDALPIHEEADVDFRSEIDGRMHACGHDCHTAMLLGAARLLKAREKALRGTVKLLFQPAEEGGAGGRKMCEEGVLEDPPVERIFGLHVWPYSPTGTLTSREGTFLAATTSLRIDVTGKGGHAAMPHQTIDPVVTAAKLIVELQTLVSREQDPLRPAVVTLTAVHGGEAFNVIPPTVQIRGTIRATTLEDLNSLKARLRDVCDLVARANRCAAEVVFPGNDYPPTVNDGACWRLVRDVAGNLLGADSVLESPPLMAGEDFSYYVQRIPGCFAGLGVRNERTGAVHAVHHPAFKADEDALPIGAALHTAFALRALSDLR
jgi:IAA-amino acid hydrolase